MEPEKNIKKAYTGILYFAIVFLVLTVLLQVREISAVHEAADGMVLVPAGKFTFGDKDEGTEETIDLKAFYIDKYEVTNEDYKKVKHDHKFSPDKAKHPVTNVSWHDANTYCKSVGKRLPTEEEWEKAARGTSGISYPWGENFDKAKANTRESDINGTTPAGKYEAGKSPYGVYDMAGNVREWTDNWYDEKKIYKSVRGGAFIDDEDSVYTFAVRKSIPEDKKEYVGFRCAK